MPENQPRNPLTDIVVLVERWVAGIEAQTPLPSLGKNGVVYDFFKVRKDHRDRNDFRELLAEQNILFGNIRLARHDGNVTSFAFFDAGGETNEDDMKMEGDGHKIDRAVNSDGCLIRPITPIALDQVKNRPSADVKDIDIAFGLNNRGVIQVEFPPTDHEEYRPNLIITFPRDRLPSLDSVIREITTDKYQQDRNFKKRIYEEIEETKKLIETFVEGFERSLSDTRGIRKKQIVDALGLELEKKDEKELEIDIKEIERIVPADKELIEKLFARFLEDEKKKKVPNRENIRSLVVSALLNLLWSMSAGETCGHMRIIFLHVNAQVRGACFFTQKGKRDAFHNTVAMGRYVGARLHSRISDYELYKNSLKTAIAAIMSRNMSHNIGSHVLARMSYEEFESLKSDDLLEILKLLPNVESGKPLPDGMSKKIDGRSPLFAQDARIFSAYLQQRMDFIAQICTDWPTWTDTACLSRDLMARFLRQRPLLEHIAKSEGLTATIFDSDGVRIESGRNRIGFVMRLIKPTGKGKKGERIIKPQDITPILNFTAKHKYDDAVGENADGYGKNFVTYPHRIPVAFPGGQVGWHAFYVILEGIIRNAAKHSFSRLELDPKQKEDVNLDVIIDVIDEGEKANNRPAYTVRIYTNVDRDEHTKPEEGAENHDNNYVDISREEQKKLPSKYKDKTKRRKWQSDRLNGFLTASFITDAGDIEKKHWGLSECRVSAGYLQMASITDIGGKQDDDRHNRVLFLYGEEPIACDQCKPTQDENKYEENDPESPVMPDRKSCTGCGSELIKPICRICRTTGNHAYHDDVYDLTKNGFRDECPHAKDKEEGCENPSEKSTSCKPSEQCKPCAPRIYFEFKMLKPQIIGIDTKSSKSIASDTKDSSNGFATNQKSKRESEGWLIDPDSTSCDYYVFAPNSQMGKQIVKTLTIGEMQPYDDGKEGSKEEKEKKEKETVYDHIDKYPGRLFVVNDDAIPEPKDDSTKMLRKRICVLTTKEYKERLLESYNDNAQTDATGQAAFYLLRRWVQHILKEMRNIQSESVHVYQYLSERLTEEKPYTPCTTPFIPKKSGDSRTKGLSELIPVNLLPLPEGCKERHNVPAVLYGRHDGVLHYRNGKLEEYEREPGPLADGCQVLYGEAFSGDCSYFTGLESAVKSADHEKLLRFVETGLLRVVLIDERIQEQFGKASLEHLMSVSQQGVMIGYLDSIDEYHQIKPSEYLSTAGYVVVKVAKPDKGKSDKDFEVGTELERTGTIELWPLDTEGERMTDERKERCSAVLPFSKDTIVTDNIDILVIHQGIIDKWKEKDPNYTTGALIKALQMKFPFVVITSGRGRPADVPKGVKFLPLSGFSLGPNKKQYEKHPLIQQMLAFSE